MRTAIITVAQDVTIHGYGVVHAGTYTVEMPENYEPSCVGAEDMVLDAAITIVSSVLA